MGVAGFRRLSVLYGGFAGCLALWLAGGLTVGARKGLAWLPAQCECFFFLSRFLFSLLWSVVGV